MLKGSCRVIVVGISESDNYKNFRIKFPSRLGNPPVDLSVGNYQESTIMSEWRIS